MIFDEELRQKIEIRKSFEFDESAFHKPRKVQNETLEISNKREDRQLRSTYIIIRYIYYIFLASNVLIAILLIMNWSFIRFIVARQQRTCLLRSCNQIIIGRRLRYGRVLAIVNNEEYLREVSHLYINAQSSTYIIS